MKPKLAIIASAPSPYRIHQHLRIAEEMSNEVELWSLFLHEHNWQPWSHALPEVIRPITFRPGETAARKTRPRAIANDWLHAAKITKWLEEQQIEAVVTAGYHSPALARVIWWCRRNGVPNYLFGDSNVYGDNVTGWRRWIKQRYVGWAVRSVDGLLPCGEYGRRFFERYGGREKPNFYMPHEPDYRSLFEVTSEDRRRSEEKFHLPPNRRRIVYTGRLAKVKRIDTLIEAFAKIARERPTWDLLIVGGGPLEAELKASVPHELQNRVAWTGFIDNPDELAALYQCGEIFVLPSDYEPWAVVVCEAAAAGLAIMASRVVGAAGELCRDGVNGRTFTPGNVTELADALLEATGDDQLLATYRQASLRLLDEWRRRGDPVQGVRLALAHAGLLPAPPPVEPFPATPSSPGPAPHGVTAG